eukprot:TRINITY_DN971_c0_g2_i1.p1 TRINITY_DN971_c0_g2~~TRINITY_DN971_c0_g2_i1.p1  ORF type:complete len:340 (-),score=55.03 TRINITY_DN971_c0_g2_i1:272-1291(-)
MLRRRLIQLANALKRLWETVFASLLGRPRPPGVDAESDQVLSKEPHQQHLEVPHQQHVEETHRELIQGVYCLYEPEGDTKAEFDVVFIQGLRVGPGDQQWRTTWTTRGGTECWPETWLRQCFPGGRVLALSYDSSTRGDPLKLWESAINSVNALASYSVQLGERPYFLVGHSLGGLLAKEVLLRANQLPHREEKPGLKDRCKGIVFYGVPHLDAEIKDMNNFFKTATGNEIEKKLKELSGKCFKRNIDFHGLQKDYPAYHFIETEETDNVMVVPKEVAGYNADSGNMVLIQNANHFEVCKPSKMTDFIFANFVNFVKSQLTAEDIIFQYTEPVAQQNLT